MANTLPSFGQRAVEILGFYVYALFDPAAATYHFTLGRAVGTEYLTTLVVPSPKMQRPASASS